MDKLQFVYTSDVAPVVYGQWIEDRMEIKCSACGARYDDEILFMPKFRDKYGFIGLEFCPHCGAKMDGDPGPIRISHGELAQMEREAKT